jgi:hypothetical protein
MADVTVDSMGRDSDMSMLHLMTANADFAQKALDAFSALRAARATGVGSKMLDARNAWDALCKAFGRS